MKDLGLPKAVQTLPVESGSAKSTQTETNALLRRPKKDQNLLEAEYWNSRPAYGKDRRTPGGVSVISRPQSLKLSEISSGRSSASGRTELPMLLPSEGSPESHVEEWLMTPGKFRRNEDEVEHEKTPTKRCQRPRQSRC